MEIETLAALRAHLAEHGGLAGTFVQSVDLTGVSLAGIDVAGATFLGSAMTEGQAAELRRGGALIFPRLPGVPFDAYRGGLYTPDELYDRLDQGYAATLDATVYGWWRTRAQPGDLGTQLACVLHDNSMLDALAEVPLADGAVGIMGGHALGRASAGYAATARLGYALAVRGFTVVTGGGPGAMEAANLGASLAGHPHELEAALAQLAGSPDFHDDVDGWARAAFAVRRQYRCDHPTIGIPTWFYGHEPPNAFATVIAKFFANAVREDVLLRLCRRGLVFVEGAAGTVQEIFQTVTGNYYAPGLPDVSPMILLGHQYWTRTVPAWPLLKSLATGRTMASAVHLVDSVEEALSVLGAGANHHQPAS